ncbi:MAG: serine hydrolase, partial [Chloroflexota bacterium]
HLDPGLRLTFRDLLTAMITVSDNTATDMVLDRVGAGQIMTRLEAWGLKDLSVRMGVQQLFDSAFWWPDSTETMPRIYRDIVARGPLLDPFTGSIDERYLAAVQRGSNWDAIAAQRSLENNVASPRAIGELLERLVRGDLLSHRSTGVALDIMLRQQLNRRLPLFLPPSAVIAHKTGTFYASRNDAGILYLPDAGRVVIVTFAVLDRDRLAGDPLESVPYIDRVDGAMGRIARSTFDAFSPEPSG